ncbi:HAMP domain-containing histidine kinase [Loktanella sp. TSTF-M6]|uniref:histidine kinase n=1 Tax=Loktanella gaetbuli TaxID=2881335 RepID=A0ABS8BSB0_9RHOB|nr:HAMP domain-containing sensor histidine kinase [Loktanella gaetbuli]MCB5198620.1 HAMP domain-containing histidine kinase [Loktanella gaetbuli]
MTFLQALSASPRRWFSVHGREQKIKDYIALSNQLIWKRQASFLAAAILAAFYFDPSSVVLCYAFVVFSEILDLRLGSVAANWDGRNRAVGRAILWRITINTLISATAISIFSVNMAIQQTSGGHFTPLFLLFSASVFAAMHNSQMIGILLLRLGIYGIAFLTIALLDVMRELPAFSSPIWLEFFTVIFVLYFLCDISIKFNQGYRERYQQLRRIEQEHARAKAALEVKTRFLATVSHELRTPLTSIIGSLELINGNRLGAVPDNLKPAITIAARNARRLADLVEDLLDMQKIEAGEMVFDLHPISVNTLAIEAAESIAGYASNFGIVVETDLCAQDALIAGDRKRLIQVMNNMLSNAIKFSEKGGTVTVQVETFGQRTRVSVHDHGQGIPDGARENVFGRFTQVDSSDIRKVGGTGLGLNISKLIVEQHGGLIDYTSELGVGSTFFVEFDRQIGDADTDDGGPYLSQVA